MKDSYVIIINDSKKNKNIKHYEYSFGNTKNIKLELSKNWASISFNQQSNRNIQVIISGKDKLFNDAIKKVMLIHQLLFNKSIDCQNIKIKKNNSEIANINENPIYSLVENTKTEFSDRWECLVPFLLDTTQSKEDERNATIKNLILANKEKTTSIKFIYVWMAMNGFYKRIINIAKQKFSNENVDFDKNFEKHKDSEEIKFLARLLFGKNFYVKKGEKELITKAKKIICSIEPEIFDSDLTVDSLCCNTNLINSELLSMSLEDESGYSCGCFMLLWLPYRLRCLYFHSESSLPIYAHKNESILKLLDLLNRIIILFLNENIPTWFVDDVGDQNLKKMKEVVKMKWEKK